VLLDSIQQERHWAQAILINPAALTHTSYALRECLRIVDVPTVEVHLEDIRRRETWRRKSVIKDVCAAQVMGKGLLSYLDGLERLVKGKYKGLRNGRAKAAAEEKHAAPAPAERTATPITKTLGRAAIPSADPKALLRQAAQAAPAGKVVKTLGRAAAPSEATRELAKGITRAAVRERIAARLGRKITASALATWAREQWLNVERGAATEMGQRDLLAEALQTLALSATPGTAISENELVELMARLDQ